MTIDIITLFPDMLREPLQASILGRAQQNGYVTVNLVNLRDFARDKHRSVDAPPFGGGAGMVLRADVLFAAVESVRRPETRVVLLTPQGTPFRQHHAQRLAEDEHIVLICGHYEGVDERVRQVLADSEYSIGDFVLTNGNIAALAVSDATVRLLPGVLGSENSAADDSFGADGAIEFPHYTKPAVFRNMAVPDVLRSGDHGRIEAWRQEQSRLRTVARRPDLMTTILHGEET